MTGVLRLAEAYRFLIQGLDFCREYPESFGNIRKNPVIFGNIR